MRKKKVVKKSAQKKNSAKKNSRRPSSSRGTDAMSVTRLKMPSAIYYEKEPRQGRAGTEKVAYSSSVHHVVYKVKHYVGWFFVALFLVGVVSIVATEGGNPQKKSPLAQKLSKISLLTLAENEPISIIATGDVLLARSIEQKMRRLKDYTYPFHKVADFLKSADISFGNLETPFLDGKTTPANSMVFRADPESAVGLVFAGFDLMTVANNHTMNYKAPGLLRVIEELNKVGIQTAGGGKNQDEAHTPAWFRIKGKAIAFYAYNEQKIPPGFHGEATADAPGIAKMDIEVVKNDVKNALKHGADYVIVSMHAGREYKKEPTEFQRDFAHAAIDAGASVVIGHHSHVVQPIEEYGDGVIAYSLGNFVFDQYFSKDVKTGLLLKITLDEGERPAVEMYPTIMDAAQPKILEGDEREKALEYLGLKN